MEEAIESTAFGQGAVIPLARRADLVLGNAILRPPLRQIEGPSGKATGEPRVIQVLLALADARGTVLSREDLLRICWNGRIVGDDAINRAVAEARKIIAVAGADFELETVPRVGYRIAGLDWDTQSAVQAEIRGSRINRRQFVAGGLATSALLAGGGVILFVRNKAADIDALVERGRMLQSSGLPDDQKKAETLFRQAIARDPKRADAWGWLAAVQQDPNLARDAALQAIALDPKEPNARTIIAYQRQDLEDWTDWEDTLLGVLADAPDNALALDQITLFYQGMGRCKDSLLTNERAIRAEPFNPSHQARRAFKHWIFGNPAEADKVANRAVELWPREPVAWNARILLYAFTDRGHAGLAFLDDLSSRPANITAPSVESWRATLEAIVTRRPGEIEKALEICTRTARLAPGLAANAIMTFSYLGQLDAAYSVAAGLFEGQGSIVQKNRGKGIHDVYSGPGWGRTQFLFIPATDSFRKDARFPDLCRRIGHMAYWRKRGIWPDPFVRGALDPAMET